VSATKMYQKDYNCIMSFITTDAHFSPNFSGKLAHPIFSHSSYATSHKVHFISWTI